jgi:pseudouridine synthase
MKGAKLNKKDRVTLDRLLSKFGLSSRADAKDLIRTGRVRVNGKVIKDDQFWVQPESDVITVDGKRARRQRKIYLMFNKPKGVVTTRRDRQAEKTVYDYLSDIKTWVFPVGRLDKNTSGLLIFTNDTAFGDRLTSPQWKVPKTYLAKVSGLVSEAEMRQLSEGIVLDDGVKTLPATVRLLRVSEKNSWLELTITEGKNRQVRRMFEALGRVVLKLVRIRIGGLPLGNLEVGKYRHLTPDEVRELQRQEARDKRQEARD